MLSSLVSGIADDSSALLSDRVTDSPIPFLSKPLRSTLSRATDMPRVQVLW